MKSKRIDRFLGINTRLPEFSLVVRDVGRYVRDALNVMFNKDGSVESRMPISLIAAITGAHSLYGNYLVRASSLYRFTVTDGTYSEQLVWLLSTNERMSYTLAGGMLFMSNGVERLRLNREGELVEWGLPAPAAPTLSASPAGLPKASYQVALAYASQEEEGCLSPASLIDDAEGVLVTMPPPIDGATHVNVYVSGVNGNVPMFSASVPVGESTYEVTALPTGRESARRIEALLPAGSRIFEYNGRLCSVLGKTLYVGLPYRHGYYLPAEGVITFTNDVQIAVGNQAGIYIATSEKTQFFVGADPTKVDSIVDVLPYGGVAGTEFDHPTDANVGWFSAKGFVTADNSGVIKELMVNTIADPSASGAATCVLTAGADGKKNYLAMGCGWIINLDTQGASRLADALGVFNSFSGDYALSNAGLCKFDAAGDVEAFVDLGKEDFDNEYEKHMPAVYIGAASTAPVVLDVTASGITYSYPARSFSTGLNVHRAGTGKGLRDNWFGLKIKNSDGGLLKLASLSFGAIQSARKI